MSMVQPEIKPNKMLKRGGIAGIAIGALALLACELPIILAVIGFSSLGAGLLAFRPPLFVEIIAIALLVISAIVLIYSFFKRVKKPERTSEL